MKPELKIAPTKAETVLPEIRVMRFKEWSEIKPLFCQRNHEARIKENKHIQRFEKMLPTHLMVAAVVYSDGRIFKVDGHTRTEAWLADKNIAPTRLNVTIYRVENDEEARAIYNSIDNKEQTKTSADSILSAMREIGITCKSALIASGKIGYALNLATGRNPNRYFTKMQQLIQFKQEVKILDSILPEREWFKTASIAATLLTIKRDGDIAKMFWSAVNAGDFEMPTETNAHTNMRALIKSRDFGNSQFGSDGQNALLGKMLFIYETWLSNRSIKFELPALISIVDGESFTKLFIDTLKEKVAVAA